MPELFNVHGFGPPTPFTGCSAWPRVDHGVSGRTHTTRIATLRLAFASAPGLRPLSLAVYVHSPVHYAKGTPSPVPIAGHRAPTACRCTVSGAFDSANSCAFHRSIALLVRYRSSRSIQPWAVGRPASRGVPRAPRYSGTPLDGDLLPSRTGLSPSVVRLSRRFRWDRFCNPSRRPQPRGEPRFGLSPLSLAATHGIDALFLFLRVLRCFSSPRSLCPPYAFRRE